MADDVKRFELLLIEDNQGDADLFREYLIDYPDKQFEIRHATTLKQALAELCSRSVDLIVLDLILPDSSGIETIEYVHREARRTPLVVLSGIADEELGRRAIQAGAQDFLHKDALDTRSLTRSLRYATERGRLQNQLRLLVENNADAIVVVDRDGVVTYLNQAAERLYGRGHGEIIGTTFGFDIDGDGISEIELQLPDGEHRAAEVRAAPIMWEGKAAWLATIRDITDRKRAEELQRRLHHADRLASIGQLASGVAHEVNNPASFIQGNLEILQESLSGVEAALRALRDASSDPLAKRDPASVDVVLAEYNLDAMLDEMHAMLADNLVGIDRISKIVRALSSFSRIERDETEVVDLNEIIEVACSMTYNEIRHRAVLHKELGDLPTIMGDRGKLAQVFTNLLINAAHAIEPGAADKNRIHIVTRATDDAVIANVADTGCGIPENILDQIFAPFFTTKPRDQGTGLGLPLSADIVQSHGGRITATSKVGEGTCFEVTLPRRSDETGGTPTPPRPSLAPVEARTRGRVLVIDDEPMLLESLQRMLRRSHQVDTAEGGQQGIVQLERSPAYDVIVCDLMMPDVDGIQLYHTVEKRWPELIPRIIVCSGGAFTVRAKDFIDAVDHINLVIPKPITRSLLLEAVDRVMEAHGRAVE